MTKEDKVLNVLNEMIKHCEPIKYMDFNKFIKAVNEKKLLAAEKKYPELGLSSQRIETAPGKYEYQDDWYGVSTLSMFATITDILTSGKRLAFNVETEGDLAGYITSVSWFDKHNLKELAKKTTKITGNSNIIGEPKEVPFS